MYISISKKSISECQQKAKSAPILNIPTPCGHQALWHVLCPSHLQAVRLASKLAGKPTHPYSCLHT